MSKEGKFLIINESGNDYFLIIDKLHNALYENNLIEELSLEEENLEIQEKNDKATLKKAIINELNYQGEKSEIKRIWKINLENNIPGISTRDKTTEIALLVLEKFEGENYRLNVVLIELKSLLKLDTKKGEIKSSLIDIERKFKCTMNRLYLLLSLNNHQNPQKGYDKTTIQVRFLGAIFYNKNDITINDNDGTQLDKILHNKMTNSLLTVETIIQK